MRIVVGADHAGFELKENIAAYLRELGHQVTDVGTNSTAAVDYPDFAEAVGKAVLDGGAERGVLICGSGVGASVSANKLPGIRAGLCHARGNNPDACTRNQFHSNASMRIHRPQIVNQLRQIFDRINIMVRRRRDQADARSAMADAGNFLIDLVAR